MRRPYVGLFSARYGMQCRRNLCGEKGPSIKRRLRTPSQAGEVRVLAFLCRPVEFGGLSLCTAFFFVSLLLPLCFLTVPLSGCGFAWSCDDALLPGEICLYEAYWEAPPRLRIAPDALDPGLGRPSFSRERESVSGLNP